MKILITSILTIFISVNLVSFNENIKEIDLPELGDRVSGAVSSDEEKAIGEMFLQQVYSNAPLISDPIIFEYTEHLIYRLSEYSQVKDRYFKILLIDDENRLERIEVEVLRYQEDHVLVNKVPFGRKFVTKWSPQLDTGIKVKVIETVIANKPPAPKKNQTVKLSEKTRRKVVELGEKQRH